ncbi:MAG TPA: hypothetical protein VLL08_30705 [Kineosporiaceae bacterium]|nr:hypothetical protein [Kineosporiaceae bacterium]
MTSQSVARGRQVLPDVRTLVLFRQSLAFGERGDRTRQRRR